MSHGIEILVEELCYSADGNDILRDLNLSIGAGSTNAVVGPSGAGKTTLLRCIAGLEKPTKGRVTINGQVPKKALEAFQIGYVFQDLGLFDRTTVEDNILLGERLDIRSGDNLEILKTLGISDLLARTVDQLSGGERQRVAIARALVRRPRILVMDEPFANIDRPLATELESLIHEFHSRFGFTLLIVSHDVRSAMAISDTFHHLVEGAIVESGLVQKLAQRPKKLSTLRLFSDYPLVEITQPSWRSNGTVEFGERSWAKSEAIELYQSDPSPKMPGFQSDVKVLKRTNNWNANTYLVSPENDLTSKFVAVAPSEANINCGDSCIALVANEDVLCLDGAV